MLVPPSETTVRVVPTPKGRGEVQTMRFRLRHQPSGASAVSSDQTSLAGRGTSNVSASRTGAVSKNVSSTGFAANQGRATARLYPRTVAGSAPAGLPSRRHGRRGRREDLHA